jgi:pimeloyl-ACP methyl ester carboxylesterase
MAQQSVEMCDAGELVFFEEATHWVQHDEPERVVRLLLDFLR